MFTANSMNCLTEALGLALPGNGSTLATHEARRDLFFRAGTTVMDLARRYYGSDDDSVLPRSIATREAFVNAMALDMAMGGSTNTVLHILAAAREGEVDFTLADIDEISRRVPCLSKVSPNSSLHDRRLVVIADADEGGPCRRQLDAGGELRLGERAAEGRRAAHDLAGRLHLGPEDRVDAGEAHEREHRRLHEDARRPAGPRSARAAARVFPTITRAATFASGTPVAFDRYGTVRDARGFTSRT